LKEHPTIHKGFTSSCLLLLALIGLSFIALMTFNNRIPGTDDPWRKALTGSIFASICISGTLFALFPSKCLQMFHFRPQNGDETSNKSEAASINGKNLRFRGHHPSCGNFWSHTFEIGNETFCAGCFGLALGGILSLVGTILYFFADIPPIGGYLFVFWAGFVGVACGLLQYHLFRYGGSLTHAFVNIIFVLGAFLLLVGADGLTRSLQTAIYILTLNVFWIYTRIELSRWNHGAICSKCEAEPCPAIYGEAHR